MALHAHIHISRLSNTLTLLLAIGMGVGRHGIEMLKNVNGNKVLDWEWE